MMNRVKFVLKNILFKANILRETRKLNKEKYNRKINNYHDTKIIKRQYHTINPKPNNDNEPNNMKILLLASILVGQFYYMRKIE
jgi:hypothetical protein